MVAMVRSGRRTFRPRSRSVENACGEVTSWHRCRSMKISAGASGLLRDHVAVPNLIDDSARWTPPLVHNRLAHNASLTALPTCSVVQRLSLRLQVRGYLARVQNLARRPR